MDIILGPPASKNRCFAYYTLGNSDRALKEVVSMGFGGGCGGGRGGFFFIFIIIILLLFFFIGDEESGSI